MEKKEIQNKAEKVVKAEKFESNLDPKSEVVVILKGTEYTVSGDVANALIKSGRAELKK